MNSMVHFVDMFRLLKLRFLFCLKYPAVDLFIIDESKQIKMPVSRNEFRLFEKKIQFNPGVN